MNQPPLPTHFDVGATYRHEATGFEGVAQAPDKPAQLREYRLVADHAGHRRAVHAIGPHPGTADLWAVADVETGELFWVDRSLIPMNYPRVGIQTEAGPKGAPERRYFDRADLVETETETDPTPVED